MMTQPSSQAMEAARRIAMPFYKSMGVESSEQEVIEIAVVLEAYAAERVAQRDPTYDQLRAERDAALARAEAAEALAAERQMGLETDHAIYVDQLAEERERVRLLEGYITEVLSLIKRHPKTAAMLLRDALARAAGGQEEHDDQR